ncbi:OmpA family protein [Streptobacillus moniliformis]|nr:OmpA family protein [Streptobacillus moniliformis]
MKRFEIQKLKNYLKASLKNKVSINDKIIIRYIMLGFIGLSAMSYGSWLSINDNTGAAGSDGGGSNTTHGSDNTKNNTILALYKDEYKTDHSVIIGAGGKTYGKGSENVVIGFNANSEKSQSVVIGANTKSDLQNSVILGSKSYVYKDHFNIGNGVTEDDGQGVAIGNSVFSTAQATSIGNNTYAIGRSSIAIGNDDISAYENKVTQHDYDSYFKKLYEKIDKDGTLYGYGSNNKTDASKHKWSPTLAQGHGSIAIGSRSIAYADGSTALGTLAYALKNGSTAVGTLTRAEGEGAIAIGRETNVFSDNAIASGNKTLVLKEGGAAYGLSAISGGENSIAIGTDVYSNVDYDYDNSNIVLGGNQKKIETGLFGNINKYDEQGSSNDETKRGLYGFDLNGVAKTIIGLGQDNPPGNVSGAKKGDYLNSGTYFSQYKSYIDGLESGLSNAITKDNKQSTNSITIKKEEKNGVKDVAKSKGKNAIVIGSKSGAFGDNGIALGRGSFSLENNSIAIGSYSYAKSKNAIALGIVSRALGEGSIAFGNGAGVDIEGKNSMVYGHGSVAYAPNSIILGINSRVWGDKNKGDSIIIGNDASIDELKENGTVKKGHNGKSVLALGNKTNATLDNSVALGYLSATDYTQEDLDKPGYTAKGSYSIPSSTKVGVISVGKKGHERRIVNVASGYRDSDAVNVAQLKTLEDRLDGATEEVDDKVRYFSVNTDNDLDVIARKRIDYRNYVKLKVQKLTIEAREKAGENINKDNVKDLTTKLNELEKKDNIKNHASKINTLGSLEQDKYKTDNKFDFDKYIKELEKAKQEDSTETKVDSILSDEEKNKLKSNNFSNEGAKGKNSIAIGYKSSTEQAAENSISIGTDAVASKKDSIALGSFSKNTADISKSGYDITKDGSSTSMEPTWKPNNGEFAIGDGSNKTRRITGVAAGDKDTDVVNVAQLKKATSGLLNDKFLKFAGNDGKEAKIKLGETLNIKGEGMVVGTTAKNNIKVTTDKDSKILTVGLAENLENLNMITTKMNANGQKSVLSTEGLKVTGKDSKETSVTSENVEVKNSTDKTTLTAGELKITDKDGNDDKQTNKLTKTSITLTDKNNNKEDTNKITASLSEIKNKSGDSVKVEANKITIANGKDKVEITKDSVTGVTKIGKDDSNSLIFGNGNSSNAMLKVGGKELKFTTSGEHIRISNVANGTKDNDAVNVSQLKKYVDALGGNSKFENGTITGPKYNLKAGQENAKDYTNVGDALSALDNALTTSTTNIKKLENKAISFQGNGGNTDKVDRKLGETLKIQGEGTVAGATAKDNIKVEKNKDNDGLDVKLTEDLKGLNTIETKEEKGKKTKVDTNGVEVTSNDNKANLTADKLTFGAKDTNNGDKTSTTVEKSGITVKGKDDKTGVEIKSSDNGGIIKLSDKSGNEKIKIDGGKASITGLADIDPNETDGSIAVNKNYVDNQIKAIANGPFEYEAINGKEKVVRGQDNKLYKESELKDYYYDEATSKYKHKTNGMNNQEPKALENKDVTVNVMPKNGTPISIGNVASILGEEATTTSDKAAEKVKELIGNSDNSKNKVATGTDILALAKSGISFEGNTGSGEKIHRNLGEQVTIKGEGTDNKDNFTSASGNIQVKSDKAKGELTVKLSDKLTNMTSFETKELDDNGNKSKVKLDKEGLTTINKTDDNKYIMSKAGPNGTEIGKYDVNPLMNGNNKAQPTTSAKYTLEGTTIKDDKGSSNLTSNTLTLKDKDNKQGITLDNKAETPTISLSNKEGEETVKIDGGDGKDKEPTISFKVDKDKGLGVVKGLRDLTDNDPGHYAVNKRYVDNKLNGALGGVANAIAVASIPQINGKGHNIGASYGYYEGHSAFALGLSGINERGNVLYKANLSLNTRGNVGIGAGIGYQFGGDRVNTSKDNIIIDNSLDELDGINKKLEEQNNKLIAQNNKLNEKRGDLSKELKELKDKISVIEKIKMNEDDLYTLDGYRLGIHELTKSQEEMLKNIVRELNENYKNRKIYITGYTDNVSGENLNLELGLKRANVVAKKLRELGLDMSISIRKVSSSGYNNIVETNKSSSGRSSNRRVEIELR